MASVSLFAFRGEYRRMSQAVLRLAAGPCRRISIQGAHVRSVPQAPAPHTTKTIVLVEPDDAIRGSLLDWLRGAMPELCIAGAATADEAVTMARAESPCIIVVDIADPNAKGEEILESIKGGAPAADVVALTMCDHNAYRDGLKSAGACDSVLIWETRVKLPAAIRQLLDTRSGEAGFGYR
ncbi:MAG: hypothetical protein PVF54_08110 [Anaerolineae bacterium]